MPDQTSRRSNQVSGYIRMFASYKSDHILVFSMLFFVIRMATPQGLFEIPIIFGHDLVQTVSVHEPI